MKFSELTEAIKPGFTPFTLHGVEFKLAYPEYEETSKQKSTTVEIVSAAPDAIGDRMLDAFKYGETEGLDSKYKSSLKRVRGVTEEGKGILHAVFDCKPEFVQKRVNAFAAAIKKELSPAKSKSNSKATAIPRMQFPGCKVAVLQGMKDRVTKAIRALGYTIERSGYESASTEWAVAFMIDKKFDIKKFEDDLRDSLSFSGWLKVEFFDLVEE